MEKSGGFGLASKTFCMGIRYYCWAVSTEEVARALVDPWAVIRKADQRCATADWVCSDLDKAWRLLQGLFRSDWPDEPRAGYALLAGDVTYPYGYRHGYEPHVGVFARDQVRLIARDVVSVTSADLRSYCAGLCYDDEEARRSEHDYLAHHLKSAQDFTADAAARGDGIIYMIG